MKNLLRSLAILALLPGAAFAQAPAAGGGPTAGTPTVTQGPPNTAANAWPFFATVGGVAISATNGLFSNMLQGNAVLSATNGLYSNILQGNVALGATNGMYSNILQGNAALTLTNPLPTETFIAPVTNAQGGNLVPYSSAALEASHNISGAKNLYSAYAISTTGAAGYFVCVNTTTISAGAIVPIDVVPIPAGPSYASIPYSSGPAGSYGTGLSCGVTVAATPFTFTAGGSVFFYHVMSN